MNGTSGSANAAASFESFLPSDRSSARDSAPASSPSAAPGASERAGSTRADRAAEARASAAANSRSKAAIASERAEAARAKGAETAEKAKDAAAQAVAGDRPDVAREGKQPAAAGEPTTISRRGEGAPTAVALFPTEAPINGNDEIASASDFVPAQTASDETFTDDPDAAVAVALDGGKDETPAVSDETDATTGNEDYLAGLLAAMQAEAAGTVPVAPDEGGEAVVPASGNGEESVEPTAPSDPRVASATTDDDGTDSASNVDSALIDLVGRLQAIVGDTADDGEDGATERLDLQTATRDELFAALDTLIARADAMGSALSDDDRAVVAQAMTTRQSLAANAAFGAVPQQTATGESDLAGLMAAAGIASGDADAVASETARIAAGARSAAATAQTAADGRATAAAATAAGTDAATDAATVATNAAKDARVASGTVADGAAVAHDGDGDEAATRAALAAMANGTARVRPQDVAAGKTANAAASQDGEAATASKTTVTNTAGDEAKVKTHPAGAADAAKTVATDTAAKASAVPDAAASREPSKVSAEAAATATKPTEADGKTIAAAAKAEAATKADGGKAAGQAREGAPAAAALTNVAAATDKAAAQPTPSSMSDGLIVLQSDTRAGHTAMTQAHTPQVTLARGMPLAAGVAAEIARFAGKGDSRFEIRLDPPELGRVDVRLKVSDDGTVRAHLFVERSETLDNFMRDQRALERTLEQAGLKTDSGSLEFSLRSDNGGSSFEGGNDNSGSWTASGEAPDMTEMERMAAIYTNPATGRLDIRV